MPTSKMIVETLIASLIGRKQETTKKNHIHVFVSEEIQSDVLAEILKVVDHTQTKK